MNLFWMLIGGMLTLSGVGLVVNHRRYNPKSIAIWNDRKQHYEALSVTRPVIIHHENADIRAQIELEMLLNGKVAAHICSYRVEDAKVVPDISPEEAVKELQEIREAVA